MKEDKTLLQARLDKIWESFNFTSFFKKYLNRTPAKIKKGNTIFYEGDQPNRLYFIKKGYIKLYRLSRDGKDAVAYLYGPGNVLGIRALTLKDQALKHNAQAITDVEIITMPREEYINILSQHPEYLIDLLHVFIDRLNYTENKLEGFITTDATTRIANFLLNISTRFGKRIDKKINIPIPLTHQLIAELIGSVRETVTIALNKLVKIGIVKINKNKFIILDTKRLEDYLRLSK
ncbi:MAG: Crp/Fnr family transcriptional regulator [Patescibacteria group bacterium]|nr:Crp/Fnr family transcriptional regulator [Patescibacteria group bacterium]